MDAVPVLPIQRHRQLALFKLDNPLHDRLGVEMIRSLPNSPGVYFFSDAEDRLLYIGQSGNLKDRISSYGYVQAGRHPRRLLRLVHRIAKVSWQCCASAAEAQRLEAKLLLEKKPPFNRAGTWEGAPWWLTLQPSIQLWRFTLSHMASDEPTSGDTILGPYPSSYRHFFAAMIRSTYRFLNPAEPISAYPQGMFQEPIPLEWQLDLSASPTLSEALLLLLTQGQADRWLALLQSAAPAESPAKQEYWQELLEQVRKYSQRNWQGWVAPPLPEPRGRATHPTFADW